jgi:hypothetical protein
MSSVYSSFKSPLLPWEIENQQFLEHDFLVWYSLFILDLPVGPKLNVKIWSAVLCGRCKLQHIVPSGLHQDTLLDIYNNIITMARQPYLGLGLLFPRLLGLVHLWQWVTSLLAALFDSILMWLPEPSGSQSGDLGEKWPLNFAYEHY